MRWPSAQSPHGASVSPRRLAAELGCRHTLVETAEDTPRRGAPSSRNALRFRFQEAYLRPNLIYTIRT